MNWNLSVCSKPDLFVSLCSQLFWERRLKGLRSSDVSEDVLQTMELPKGLQSEPPTGVCVCRRGLLWQG